jgi:hypothetical protein
MDVIQGVSVTQRVEVPQAVTAIQPLDLLRRVEVIQGVSVTQRVEVPQAVTVIQPLDLLQRVDVPQAVDVLKSGYPAPADGRYSGRIRDPADGGDPGRVRAQVG